MVQSLVCLQLVLALGKGAERVVEGALVHPASAVFNTDLQLKRYSCMSISEVMNFAQTHLTEKAYWDSRNIKFKI